MTNQEAIRILIRSPIYFRLNLLHRKELILECCTLYDKVSEKYRYSSKRLPQTKP
jgi:hypothetical protein